MSFNIITKKEKKNMNTGADRKKGHHTKLSFIIMSVRFLLCAAPTVAATAKRNAGSRSSIVYDWWTFDCRKKIKIKINEETFVKCISGRIHNGSITVIVIMISCY